MGAVVFHLLLFLIIISTSTAHASSRIFNPIQILRPHSGDGRHANHGLNCLSWRLAVETHNIQGWTRVPSACNGYLPHYMLGQQYQDDLEMVADAAIEYGKSLKPATDGKDVWVFDVDETALSNLPFFARPDVQFGTLPLDASMFNNWTAEGKAPPLLPVRRLYNKLLDQGFKIVFLTGLADKFTCSREANLKKAGYHTWEKLILKSKEEQGLPAIPYKSKRRTDLVAEGYRIVGNVGDQWSDLLGPNAGKRTFKVPNPMYYIP